VLVALLLGHEAFQRHRDEKLSPSLPFVKQEAQDRYPDFDIPRDNLLRKAVKDPRVIAVCGQPRGRGHHLQDWEHALVR
jgi:hypothetical protein